MNTLCGFKVVVDNNAQSAKWIFPAHRFFEWEPKDEAFCRKYGIGHQIYVPACYQVGNTLIIHPSLYAELKKQDKPV